MAVNFLLLLALGVVYISGVAGAVVAIRWSNPHLAGPSNDSPSSARWIVAFVVALVWPVPYIISRVCEQLTPKDTP